jgi:hypothetical protein
MIAEKICKNCNKAFMPSKNDKRIIFCSTECRIDYRNKTGYMDNYYHANIKKWKDTQASAEYKEAKNKARRLKYATDEEYRNKHKQSVKDYQSTHKNIRLSQRMKKYGISAEDYYKLLDKQEQKCAICGAEIGDSNGNRLYVDHDHKTGKVRGLLCANCNFGIGSLKDDVEILKKAILYLEGKNGTDIDMV